MARLLAAAPSSPVAAGIVGDQPAIPAQQPASPADQPLGHDADAIDAGHAHQLLSAVGFLLVPGAPLARGASYLMIALRHEPTLSHFDPERIEYWTAGLDGSSAQTAIEWPMVDAESRYAWGPIRIVDRVRARNEFASFGGRLTLTRDGDQHAALFRSDAPILMLGGRSGPSDVLAVHVAGFFALLRAAAGDSSALRAIQSADPVALYAAFLVRTAASFRARAAAGASAPRVSGLINSELRRLERERPQEFENGLRVECQV